MTGSLPRRERTNRGAPADRRGLKDCAAHGHEAPGPGDDLRAVRWSYDMRERDCILEPFDALIGAWATEATHPLFDSVVPGGVTFEWLEGGRFLIQRSHNEHELFPDALSVIGAPEAGEGLVLEYFDSRGVRRTYRVSLEDGVLPIWRDHPTFAQRYSARVSNDAFEGQWQVARTPGDWQDDLKVSYRRLG